jgi:hypothetical protein
MKMFHKGWFVIVHSGSVDTDLVLSLYEATDVAAGTNAAVTTACPIWADTDSGTTSDVISATTAAYSYTIDTTLVPNQLVIMEVDRRQRLECLYNSVCGCATLHRRDPGRSHHGLMTWDKGRAGQPVRLTPQGAKPDRRKCNYG